jgi:hypothetical protein
MCPAIPVIAVVGSDAWNATAHSALSIAYRLRNAVQQHSAVVKLAGKLCRLDRIIAKLLNDIYTATEETARGARSVEPAEPERVKASIATLKNLCVLLESLSTGMREAWLSNNALLGASLQSLVNHTDDLLDLTESLELGMLPDIDKLFDKSLEEYERGEIVGIDSL